MIKRKDPKHIWMWLSWGLSDNGKARKGQWWEWETEISLQDEITASFLKINAEKDSGILSKEPQGISQSVGNMGNSPPCPDAVAENRKPPPFPRLLTNSSYLTSPAFKPHLFIYQSPDPQEIRNGGGRRINTSGYSRFLKHNEDKFCLKSFH